MSIIYNPDKKSFHLQNDYISYVLCIEEDRYLAHSYWGKKIKNYVQTENYPRRDLSFSPNPSHYEGREFSLDTLPQEYPGNDTGDFRESAFEFEYEDGTTVTQLEYKDFKIIPGKKKLKGLPATYIKEEKEAETLEITLID